MGTQLAGASTKALGVLSSATGTVWSGISDTLKVRNKILFVIREGQLHLLLLIQFKSPCSVIVITMLNSVFFSDVFLFLSLGGM